MESTRKFRKTTLENYLEKINFGKCKTCGKIVERIEIIASNRVSSYIYDRFCRVRWWCVIMIKQHPFVKLFFFFVLGLDVVFLKLFHKYLKMLFIGLRENLLIITLTNFSYLISCRRIKTFWHLFFFVICSQVHHFDNHKIIALQFSSFNTEL